MISPLPDNFKEISWNGIRFLRPDSWQPVTIDKNRLLLAKDGRQVLEIKWGPGGKDTPQDYVDKLSTSFKKELGCSISQNAPPLDWPQPPPKFTSANFSRQSNAGAVQGIVLRCPHCSTITLIQFFPPFNEAEITDILLSFSDHDNKTWAIFDLQFEVPKPYIIKNYRFGAGNFELNFTAGKDRLTFKRLAPAKQLLNDQNLQELALEIMEIDNTTSANNDEVVWSESPCGFFAQLGKRLRKEVLYRSGKMWLDSANNKIMALEIGSMQEIEPEEFSKICETLRIF